MFLRFDFRAHSRGGKILNRGGRRGLAEAAMEISAILHLSELVLFVTAIQWAIYKGN